MAVLKSACAASTCFCNDATTACCAFRLLSACTFSCSEATPWFASQVLRPRRGQDVISEWRRADDGEKDRNTVTAVHFLLLSFGRNKAAEMKSSTAAQRCAKNSGDNGFRPVTNRITGALVK